MTPLKITKQAPQDKQSINDMLLTRGHSLLAMLETVAEHQRTLVAALDQHIAAAKKFDAEFQIPNSEENKKKVMLRTLRQSDAKYALMSDEELMKEVRSGAVKL